MFGFRNGHDKEQQVYTPPVDIPRYNSEQLRAVFEGQRKILDILEVMNKSLDHMYTKIATLEDSVLKYKDDLLKESKDGIKEMKCELKEKSHFTETLLEHLLTSGSVHVGESHKPEDTESEEEEEEDKKERWRRLKERRSARLAGPKSGAKLP